MRSPLISSLELTNFMCHSHFLITFEKLITCVSGPNGSGKSALMIALGVLFGRRVHSLERGGSLRDLIKTGTNQAIIRVILNNHQKYKEDRYGPEIIIEKQLRSHSCKLMIGIKDPGSTTLKMRPVPTGELQRIIDRYRLRFDNPLNFMTQELSKKFLSTSTPTDLYDFYYRGSEFKDIHEELDESFRRLEEMKRRLETTVAKHTSLTGILSLHQSNLEVLSVDFPTVLNKLDLEEALHNLDIQFKKQDKLQNTLNNLIEEHTASKRRLEELNSQIKSEDDTRQDESEDEIQQIRENIASLKKKLHDIQADCAEYQEEYSKREKQLAMATAVANKDEITEQIKRLDRAIQETKTQLVEEESHEMNLMTVIQEVEKRREHEQQQAYNLKKQISFLRTHSTDSSTESLHRAFKAIEAEIKRAEFKDEVIGPVCNYIKLKDQRWYKAASIILKKSLSSYIVFNKPDKLKLFEIFKKIGQNFTVCELSSRKILKNIKKANLNSFKLTSMNGYPPITLLDLLDLKSDYVMNYLLIMHSAEQILMIPSRDEAYSVIRGNPPLVDCAYTPQGDRIKLVNGSLSDYKARDDGKYWFEDKQSRLHKLEETLAQMDWSAEREYKALTEQLNTLRQKVRSMKEYMGSMMADKHGLEQQLVLVEEEGDSDREEKERRCEQLKKATVSLEKKCRETESEIMEKESRLARLKESLRIEQEKREDKKKVIRVRIREEEAAAVRIDSYIKANENELKMVNEEVLSRLREVNSGIINSTVDSDTAYYEGTKEAKRAKIIRNSLNGGQEVNMEGVSALIESVNSSEEYPMKGMEAIKEQMKRMEIRTLKEIQEKRMEIKGKMRMTREMPSREETERVIEKIKVELAHYETIRDRYESMILDTIAACERRLLKRDEIKEKKTREAMELFGTFTRQRGYSGELIFDHDKQMLDMRVKVHGNEEGGMKDTLSGGERSYAAVCFLIALWKSFLCPIKVLDEFDVFMDPINRNCAIKMLFDVLVECKTQAILITPLSMEDFKNNICDIKVLEKVIE